MKTKYTFLVLSILLIVNTNLFAQDPMTLPLITIDDLDYQGAFIIPSDDFGESNSNYSAGAIAYNSANHSIFIAGHRVHGAIAEFSIPTIVNSTDVTELNSSTNLQGFRTALDDTPDLNPQNINEISGMEVFEGQLLVNAVEYYDAPANNTHTTLVIDDITDIVSSTVQGFYALNGAAHAAGWMSPIPEEWQILLGGTYVAGSSSKFPINSRSTMGISAFVFNPVDLSGDTDPEVPADALLDFDLSDPLYADYSDYENGNYNLVEVNGTTFPGHTFEDADAIVGTNDLWTEVSQASYGLIIPGTRTYLTIGSSGGHNSGIGYKPTQNNGNLCGGPCPYDAADYYNYYWLWDVNDLLDVKDGTINAFDVRPYAYGVFDAPFQTDLYTDTAEFHSISGGTYDTINNVLYLTLYDGAPIDEEYARNPLIMAYKINVSTAGISETESINNIQILPNPVTDLLSLNLENNDLKRVFLYNEVGQLVKESTLNKVDVSSFPSGIYYLKIILKNEEIVFKKMVKV